MARYLMRVRTPLLGLSFKRIGDRAGAGLVAALEGERLPERAA